MQERGLQAKVRNKRRRTTDSQHAYPGIPTWFRTGSGAARSGLGVRHHLCAPADGVCVPCGDHGRLHMRHPRLAPGPQPGPWPTLTALQRALADGHQPEIHHSDQGSISATAYVETLQARGAALSMAEVGEAWQNSYAERLVYTIKEEEVDLSEYRDYQDAIVKSAVFWTMCTCTNTSTLPWAT